MRRSSVQAVKNKVSMSLLNEKIVYNADKSVNRACCIKAAGHVFPDPAWAALREEPKDALILFIAEGKAKLSVPGGEYPLYKGDCVVFPPKKYSKLQSDAKTPPEVYWLRCGGDLVDAFVKAYFPNMRAIVATCDVKNFFVRITDILSHGDAESADTLCLILHKLFVTIKNCLGTAPSGKGKSMFPSNKYEEYILSHMYDKLDVHDFADHFGMSVPALTAALKRKFGKTPYQYYLSVKIELAKKMLATGKTSVEDIAERLCFTDRTHFSKLFKRETGMSPAQFRNKNAAD